MSIKRFYLAIIFLLYFSASLYANQPVIITDSQDSYPLGLYLDILEDKTKTLTFEDIQKPVYLSKFIPSKEKVPNYGSSSSAFWFKVNLENKMINNEEIILDAGSLLFDKLELYISQPDKKFIVKKSTDSHAFNQKEISHRNFIFKISFLPDEAKMIYFRLESERGVYIPVTLWKTKSFWDNEQDIIYLLGAFFGIMIVMFLYNIMIYLSIKDKNYLFYIIYLFFQIFYTFFSFGLSYQYLFPNHPFFNQTGSLIVTSYLGISIYVFSKNFLNLKNNAPFLNKIYLIIIFILFISGLLPIIIERRVSIIIINISILMGAPVIIISAIYVYKKGFISAKYFIIAWFFFLCGTFLFLLQKMGLIANNSFTSYSVQAGMVLEVVLLSFALTDRINIAKKEKEQAEEKIISMQKNYTVSLENEIVERTTDLARANEKLKELDVIKTNFFMNVSHELRTPLTVILSSLESIRKKMYGETISSSLPVFNIMEKNSKRLLKLINNILDFSKIEAGRMELAKKPANMNALISNCITSIGSASSQRGIAMSFLNPEEPIVAMFDSNLMENVIYNLLSNAIKFNCDNGKISVNLTLENNNIRINVSDTGIGIPENRLLDIFERFSQVDSSSTRKYEGTGIGLALTKEIVEMHGGSISVKSVPGEGSCFTVLIPYEKSDSKIESNDDKISELNISDSDNPEITNQAENIKTNKPGGTILVVEDNNDMRSILASLLSNQYNVLTASNGKEALSLLETGKPDLLLSDVMMPVMDGFELVTTIRNDIRFERLPVILLTARADVSDTVYGISTGANDYISKPFNSQELLARVASHIKMKKLHEKYIQIQKENNSRDIAVTDEVKEKVNLVSDYIKENYRDDISREGLAAAVDLSPDFLSRMYKKETGKRIIDVINEYRIEDSCRMLMESDKKIITICHETGFESLRTFNRIFFELKGVKPTDFRKKYALKQE